jgi:hypothetical protein
MESNRVSYRLKPGVELAGRYQPSNFFGFRIGVLCFYETQHNTTLWVKMKVSPIMQVIEIEISSVTQTQLLVLNFIAKQSTF